MGKVNLKSYYKNEEEFTHFHQELKHLQCPHCSQRGFLILHGYLYGYAENENWGQRGHRFFCSNRYRKNGCGRTFGLLQSDLVKNFMINAGTLAAILVLLSKGACPFQIHQHLRHRISKSSVYRICRRFRKTQPGIRTLLTRIKDPPTMPDTTDPLIQTIIHLRSAFTGCFTAKFQHLFQVSIL